MGEEVGLRVGHRHAEDLRPAARPASPRSGSAGPPRRGRRCSPRAAATAARRGRPCPTSGSAGRRPPRAAARARRAAARAGASAAASVSSSRRRARRSRPAPGCRPGCGARPPPRRDTGQREQRGVDLAQLDAPPAELDLLVGAPEEQQPGLVGADDVAAAVGALPAQRGQRSELRGVLVRVEVAGEPDPADHQLAASRPSRPARPRRRRRRAPSRRAAARSAPAPRRSAARRRRRRWPRSGRRCSTPRGPRRRAARPARAGTPRRRRSAAAPPPARPAATARRASARWRRP